MVVDVWELSRALCGAGLEASASCMVLTFFSGALVVYCGWVKSFKNQTKRK